MMPTISHCEIQYNETIYLYALMRKFGIVTSIFILLNLLSTSSFAQGYHIEVNVKSLKDTSCIMGHFNYNDKQFIAKDTARADSNGKLIFSGKNDLPGGLYIVVLPGQRHLVQFIYSGTENKFTLTTDTLDIISAMKVEGSVENSVFYDYQKQIRDISMKMRELDVKKQSLGSDKAALEAEATKLANAHNERRDKLIAEYKHLFVGKLMNATIVKQMTSVPKKADGQPDNDAAFNYYRDHFWDNFDLSDARMLRTPFFQPKLESYIKNLTVQVGDSLIKTADALIAKVKNKEVRDYMIYYITNEYETPTTVGTENVFVHMAEKYYLNGDMPVSEDGKKRIKERVAVLKPLLVNKVFPELSLTDPSKKNIRLQQIQADYTVVFFYSPTCGHCKEAAPKLKAAYDTYKDKGVKILAVAIDQDKEWEKYVKDHNLSEIMNGYDFTNQIDFRTKYDVISTPMVYILDKGKRIIARRMPVEQLSDFLNFTINKANKL